MDNAYTIGEQIENANFDRVFCWPNESQELSFTVTVRYMVKE